MSWWSSGYVSIPNATIPDRFLGEARASLPSLAYTREVSLDGIFSGMALQRLRLKQDQQVPGMELVISNGPANEQDTDMAHGQAVRELAAKHHVAAGVS